MTSTEKSSGALHSVLPALPERRRVLVVDDEPQIRRAYIRILGRAGFEVVASASTADAVRELEQTEVDLVVTDISMPTGNGIDLLAKIRERDAELPVIIVTGGPTMESAIEAVQLGAFRYLSKPVSAKQLCEVAEEAVRKRRSVQLGGAIVSHVTKMESERLALVDVFTSALGRLYTVYQPIVSVRTLTLLGYEALVRSEEPSLTHPGAIFDAAHRLDGLRPLGRAVRRCAPLPLPSAPTGSLLFVNLHSTDLLDESLFDPCEPLAAYAKRVVLELTERESLDSIDGLRERLDRLRGLGFRIAIDDLGAGYSSFASLAEVEPEIVKLDMTLVRGVNDSAKKQTLVRSLVRACDELRAIVIAEGVETAAERDALLALGCDFMQGYFFGKPGRAFPAHTFG